MKNTWAFQNPLDAFSVNLGHPPPPLIFHCPFQNPEGPVVVLKIF